MATVLLEAIRAVAGLSLPFLLVTLPNDDYVTSMATGGEWVRLNGSEICCFGHAPASDSRCRYLAKEHCEANRCIWADPSAARCVLTEQAPSTCESAPSRSHCGAIDGCQWRRPLDLRVNCTAKAGPFGGLRCEAVVAGTPGALDAIRAEMRVLLQQLVVFGLGNLWLVRWFGSIDMVVANGKPWVVGLFALVAGLGAARQSLLGS